jgi:hypothetical protein
LVLLLLGIYQTLLMSGVSKRNNFPTFHSIPCSYHIQIYPSHHRRYSSPLDFIPFHVRKRSTSKHLCPASITSFQALLQPCSCLLYLISTHRLCWCGRVGYLHYTTLQYTTIRYTTLHYPTAILAYRISPIFTFIFIFTASFTTQPYPSPSPDLPTAHSLISAPTAISCSSPHHLPFLPCHITSSQQLLDGAARLHFAICLTMKRRVCM